MVNRKYCIITAAGKQINSMVEIAGAGGPNAGGCMFGCMTSAAGQHLLCMSRDRVELGQTAQADHFLWKQTAPGTPLAHLECCLIHFFITHPEKLYWQFAF
jgi:hypothetical protein